MTKSISIKTKQNKDAFNGVPINSSFDRVRLILPKNGQYLISLILISNFHKNTVRLIAEQQHERSVITDVITH